MSKWKARIGCGMAAIGTLNTNRVFADNDPLSGRGEPDEPLSGLNADPLLTDSSIWGSYIQMFVVLIIIIVMILLIVKFLSQKNKLWLSNRAIQTLGGVSLGQHKSLQLVEIGQSVYLIGIGDNVQLLEKISDPGEVQAIMESLDRQGEAGDQLASIKSWFTKRKVEKHDEVNEEPNFQHIFQDKLQRVSGQSQKVEQLLNESKTEKDGRSL